MARLQELVRGLHELVQQTDNPELSQTVSDLRSAAAEPFLFVIVGEVKAGKSSFINALLDAGRDLCKVAPDPCTDTIQQLVYGSESETVAVNPYLRKIYEPAEILREISVVDTPGTNTISAHHQEITERFIPRSDLVVFVVEAKNPYRQSAWDFFDFIHRDWQKKIIFVLQQADLMPQADLEVNLQGLIRYAEKKGLLRPPVFAVSAKLELEGQREASGFAPLRAYIREHITGRNAWLLKLYSAIRTSLTVHGRIREDLERMQAQVRADRAFRDDISRTLQEQEARSHRQVESLTRVLLDDYDRITRKTYYQLEEGLGFLTLTRRSFASMFSKSGSPQVWLQELAKTLELELSREFMRKLNNGVEDIADSISQMARIINLKIAGSRSELESRQDIFGEISDRRRAVLQELQEGFERFMQDTGAFVDREMFPQAASFTPNLAAGGGLAVVGAVVMAVAQMTALDVTGGILSAAGLLFAGGTVLLKRGKILKGFEAEIARSRQQLHQTLDERLKAYVGHVRRRIDQNFTAFDALLEAETRHVEGLQQQHAALLVQLESLEAELPQAAP